MLLVDRRCGGQVTLFVGWAPPEKYRNKAARDPRVVFHDLDGEEHVVESYAGGRVGLQFCSPCDLPAEKLSRCVVQVRE
jgi:hypothetical protein